MTCRRTVYLAICALLVGSCADATGPAQPSVLRVDPRWVSGAASVDIDPGTGLFRLSPPGGTVLTRAGADSFALALLRMYLNPSTLGNTRASLEYDRGGPISAWTAVRPCDRTMFAESSFGAAPVDADPALRRAFRSHWGVVLCGASGAPEVAVDVSDAPTSMQYRGADFVISGLDSLNGAAAVWGIPKSLQTARALSPEAAVQAAFQRTGLRVIRPPRAIQRWIGARPSLICPSWELELEGPVSASTSTSGDSVRTTTLVVERPVPACIGEPIVFLAPAPTQPNPYWVRFLRSVDPFVLDSLPWPVVGPMNFVRLWPETP